MGDHGTRESSDVEAALRKAAMMYGEDVAQTAAKELWERDGTISPGVLLAHAALCRKRGAGDIVGSLTGNPAAQADRSDRRAKRRAHKAALGEGQTETEAEEAAEAVVSARRARRARNAIGAGAGDDTCDAEMQADRALRHHRVEKLKKRADGLADDDPELTRVLAQIGDFAADDWLEALDDQAQERRDLLAERSSDQRVRWVTAWLEHEERVTDVHPLTGHVHLVHIRRRRDQWDRLRRDSDEALFAYDLLKKLNADLRKRRRLTEDMCRRVLDVSRRGRAIPRTASDGLQRAARGRTIPGLRAAVAEAKRALEHRAQVLWPDLNLGKGQPEDIVNTLLRSTLRRWGLSHAEIEAVRQASAVGRDLLRDQQGSAARMTVHRRRARGNSPDLR